MAINQPLVSPITLIAGADLSTHQYKLVKEAGAGTCVLCAAVTDVPTGVLQNKPGSGKAATIAQQGKLKVVAGAAIAAGADVMSDTSGRVITQTSTNPIWGRALEAAGVAGQLIAVEVH